MSGLLVLKYFGVLLRYIFVVCYFHIYCFDEMVGCIQFDYWLHIKQVIISCEFCQHFHCLEVVLVSWMILVIFRYLGM